MHDHTREGSDKHGRFDHTPGQIPHGGGGFCLQIPQFPPVNMSLEQLHTSKQVVNEVLLRKATNVCARQGQTLQCGAKMSGTIRVRVIFPVCPGGGGNTLMQHIDRYIHNLYRVPARVLGIANVRKWDTVVPTHYTLLTVSHRS